MHAKIPEIQRTGEPLISIVFPAYNEAQNLEPLYAQVKEAIGLADAACEMIFVDNGSDDDSLRIIEKLRAKDPCVKYLSLSRNFGHQNALFAGMCHAGGDAVITMDADLQHPPSLIPEMIRLWKEGNEIVYTTKRRAELPPLKNAVVKIFYRLVSRISKLNLSFGESDFRLIDGNVLESVIRMPEYHKFLRGQIKWVGFRQQELPYDVQQRRHGQSKFSYRDLFAFAIDGMVSFSGYPLRLLTMGGAFIAGLSLLYIAWILLVWSAQLTGLTAFSAIPLPPGWVTLTIAILFLGSIQIVAVGILGEYVGRIFDQTKGRPNFIVRKTSGDVRDRRC